MLSRQEQTAKYYKTTISDFNKASGSNFIQRFICISRINLFSFEQIELKRL